MDINELTVGEVKQIAAMVKGECTTSKGHSFKLGTQYLIRTVTHYYTGRLKSITDTDLLLEDVAWIADTGRFGDCFEKGCFKEVEPFPNDVIVQRGCIVDATEWRTDLPRKQK